MGLFDSFTGAPVKKAAAENKRLLEANQQTGLGYLDTGKTEGIGYLGQGIEAFQPLADMGTQYNQSVKLLQDAQGVNGPEGTARAQAAFQAGPGYEWMLNQGMEGVNRQQQAAGRGASGNAMIAAEKYGQGLAQQQWNPWVQNLQAFINPAMQATQGAAAGQAGGYTNQAQLTASDAANRVNLGNTTTSGMTNANNMSAQAQMEASKNAISGIGSLASLALAIPTGGLSLGAMGAMGGGLGGLFSSGKNAG